MRLGLLQGFANLSSEIWQAGLDGCSSLSCRALHPAHTGSNEGNVTWRSTLQRMGGNQGASISTRTGWLARNDSILASTVCASRSLAWRKSISTVFSALKQTGKEGISRVTKHESRFVVESRFVDASLTLLQDQKRPTLNPLHSHLTSHGPFATSGQQRRLLRRQTCRPSSCSRRPSERNS